MEITNLTPGKYVIAVSGGVDSVVLLDILVKTKRHDLVVAHFDHGMRKDSANDEKFVESLAIKYGLVYESSREELGERASEELARKRRYEFLHGIAKKYLAGAILTAHHQDDLVETAIINLQRGTNRSGLSSLKDTEKIKRPLLKYQKTEIIKYAKKNNLKWREDSTNSETKYTRNKIRHSLSKLSSEEKMEFLRKIMNVSTINVAIDSEIESLFYILGSKASIDRQMFIELPHVVKKEIIVFWLKKLDQKYDKKLVEKLVRDFTTGLSGKRIDAGSMYFFVLDKKQISLERKRPV